MDAYDYLDELTHDEDTTEEVNLSEISALCKEMQDLQTQIAELEEKAQLLRDKESQLRGKRLPEKMLKAGFSEFKLDTGETVTVKEDVSVTLNNIQLFYDFLDERGEANIVKTNLDFGKIPKDILDDILDDIRQKYGVIPEKYSLKVHPATLKAYVRNTCGVGGKTEAALQLDDIEKYGVKAFVYYNTKIK